MTGLRTTTISAIIRQVMLYRRRMHPLRWDETETPVVDIAKLYYAQRDHWHECKAIGVAVFRGIHAPAASVGAAAHLICDQGNHKTAMLAFMDQLAGGPLPPRSPLMSLRRIMSTYAIQNGRPEYEPLAYLLRTWNLYADNAKVDIITWRPDDGMPRISKRLADSEP